MTIKNRLGRAALLVAAVGLAASPLAGGIAQAKGPGNQAILKDVHAAKAPGAILKAPGSSAILGTPGASAILGTPGANAILVTGAIL